MNLQVSHHNHNFSVRFPFSHLCSKLAETAISVHLLYCSFPTLVSLSAEPGEEFSEMMTLIPTAGANWRFNSFIQLHCVHSVQYDILLSTA